MTEDQKKIKRYVNQLERRLRLPLELKVRINGDIGTERSISVWNPVRL